MLRLIYFFYFLFLGIIFSQNNYDSNSQKTGYWVGYYDSGELRYEGYFESGKYNGLGRYIFKNGKIKEGIWKNNNFMHKNRN